jgi:hypothetical protein
MADDFDVIASLPPLQAAQLTGTEKFEVESGKVAKVAGLPNASLTLQQIADYILALYQAAHGG